MGNAQANIKAVITAEDHSGGVLKGFANQVESLGGTIAASLKYAAVAFATAGAAATVFAVKSAANFEQTRIGLENMLGSADAARAMLSKVSKFAAETPFEFPELAQATRQLVAFGFSGEDAFKTMTQLGDVSAAIGAPIGDLAYLMGTLRAQGRAFTIDIRQFAMRGIPIYEYLAKVFKVNTTELTGLIEAGKVGFPEVQKAFEMMTAEGGKFHGTMEKQSKSLSGMFSTLKDNIGLAAREMIGISQEGDVRKGSIFDRLRDAAGKLNLELGKIDWAAFSDKATAALARIITKMKEIAIDTGIIARLIKDTIAGSGPAIEDNERGFQGFANVLWDVRNGFIAVMNAIKETYQWFMNLTPVIVIGQFFQQVLVPAILAIGAAVWQNLLPALKQLGEAVIRLWNSVNPALTQALKILGAILLGELLVIVYLVISGLNILIQAFSFLISVVSNIINWISNLIAAFGNLVGIVWNTIGIIITIFSNLLPAIKGTISAIVTLFMGLGGMILSALGNLGGLLYNAGRDLIEGMINGITDGFRRLTSKVKDVVGGAVKSVKGFLGISSPSKVFQEIGQNVTSGFIRGVENGEDSVSQSMDTFIPSRTLARSATSSASEQSNTIAPTPPASVNITLQAGAFMGSQMEARKFAQMIMQAYGDLQSARGMA